MSSATGRGKERIPFDFYPTPTWCVDRLLDRHAPRLLHSHRGRLLEPTVGDGAIVRAVTAWEARQPEAPDFPIDWTGVELRRGALLPGTELDHHTEGYDFRVWRPDWTTLHGALSGFPFDLAIGNPPFSIAEGILRRCFEVSRATAMLLRLGMLGSAVRAPFWATVGADPYIRVIPEHVSFDGEGTDSSTYAWFIWGAQLSGPRVDVLDPTPASIRAAQKPRPPTGIPQLGLEL